MRGVWWHHAHYTPFCALSGERTQIQRIWLGQSDVYQRTAVGSFVQVFVEPCDIAISIDQCELARRVSASSYGLTQYGYKQFIHYSANKHDMDELFFWIFLIFEGAASRWMHCFIPVLPLHDTRWRQMFGSPSCGFWSLHCLLDKTTENMPRCSAPQPTRQLCSGYTYVHVQDHVLTTDSQQLPRMLTLPISVQVPLRWPIQLGQITALIVVYCVMQGDHSTQGAGQRGSESSGRYWWISGFQQNLSGLAWDSEAVGWHRSSLCNYCPSLPLLDRPFSGLLCAAGSVQHPPWPWLLPRPHHSAPPCPSHVKHHSILPSTTHLILLHVGNWYFAAPVTIYKYLLLVCCPHWTKSSTGRAGSHSPPSYPET